MSVLTTSTHLSSELRSLMMRIENGFYLIDRILSDLFDIQYKYKNHILELSHIIEELNQKIKKYDDDCEFVEKENLELEKVNKEDLDDEKINHNVGLRKLAVYLQKKELEYENEEQKNRKKKVNMLLEKKKDTEKTLANIEDHINIYIAMD